MTTARRKRDLAPDRNVRADLRLHLRALYTNPKGLNLRNKLAHGVAGPEMLGRGMANWVVHTLILLGAMGNANPPA